MINNISKLFDVKSKHNLVETIIEDAIENILKEISDKMYANVECRFSYYGDENEFWSKSEHCQYLKPQVYSLPFGLCSYKKIYELIENAFKESLYNREDKYENMPIVFFNGCKVNGENIDIDIRIGLLEK